MIGAGGMVFYGDGPVKTREDLDRIELTDPEGYELWGDAPAFLEAAKDYAEADRIRDELAAQGVVLEDGAASTQWRRA